MRRLKTILTHWEVRRGKKVLRTVTKTFEGFQVSSEKKLLTFPQVMKLVDELGARLTPRFRRIH